MTLLLVCVLYILIMTCLVGLLVRERRLANWNRLQLESCRNVLYDRSKSLARAIEERNNFQQAHLDMSKAHGVTRAQLVEACETIGLVRRIHEATLEELAEKRSELERWKIHAACAERGLVELNRTAGELQSALDIAQQEVRRYKTRWQTVTGTLTKPSRKKKGSK